MSHPARWLAATRPAFLSITLLAVLLGFALAARHGTPLVWSPATLTLTMLGALLAHAGANVLNDVADADNGSDACNTGRIAPYTGGSRFIQQALISRQSMLHFGWRLIAASALCGAVLLALTDSRLLVFGLGGLLLAIAYSLPPLQLMSRGLGEPAVAAAWLLIVAGSDFVLRRQFDSAAWLGGLPLALQTALILIVNQIPDRAADQRAGKRNWIVRLDTRHAATLYTATLAASYAAVPLGCLLGALPASALLALLALPLGGLASRYIRQHAANPARLAGSIRLTLLQAHLVGALLLLGLLADRYFRTLP